MRVRASFLCACAILAVAALHTATAVREGALERLIAGAKRKGPETNSELPLRPPSSAPQPPSAGDTCTDQRAGHDVAASEPAPKKRKQSSDLGLRGRDLEHEEPQVEGFSLAEEGLLWATLMMSEDEDEDGEEEEEEEEEDLGSLSELELLPPAEGGW